MRKLLSTLVLTMGFAATAANADQNTLDALQNAGVSLTDTQAAEIAAISCDSGSDCQALSDKVAELVAANSGDDAAVEAIITASISANPGMADQISDASMNAAPEAIAVIASAMINVAPTAAGPGNAPGLNRAPGLNIARSVAAPQNNIPAPAGGGGSSSPN